MKFKNINLIFLIVCMVILIVGCSKKELLEISGDNRNENKFELQELKEFIIHANSLRYRIKFEITDTVIGKYDGIDVLEIKGNYTTYDKILELMGDYFTDEIIEIELEKEYLVNLDGNIGFIAASGENYYDIEENSQFKLLIDEKDKKVIEVQMFGDISGEKTVEYTFKKNQENKWKITGEKNYFYYGNEKVSKIVYITDWDSVEASSELDDYVSEYSIDNKIDTAWVEAEEDDDGIGEWIKLQNEIEKEVSGIEITNGYCKSEEIYFANNRIKKIKVEFSDGTFFYKEFEDNAMFNFQKVDFSEKVKTKYIKIIVLEVYKGSKYKDTCISEIRVF